MSRASLHTTVRELSTQISRREKKIRALQRDVIAYDARTYDPKTKEWRKPTEDERKAARKETDAIWETIQPLKAALASLSDVMARGLV